MVAVILILALLVAITPALAASPGKIFTVLGTITALDNGSITVAVVDANKLASSYIGDALTVNVTGSTQYYQYVADGTNLTITLEDIEVGNTVNVRGRLVSDIFTAQVVTIDVICP